MRQKIFEKPIVFVSKCLEHGHCRYDGSQINSHEIRRLTAYVDFIYDCPEMAIGLPSPREALRKIKTNQGERLVQSVSGTDMTEAMVAYVEEKTQELLRLDVDGMILKSRSPSCGIKDVKIYPSHGKVPSLGKHAKGMFAEGVQMAFQDVLIEDEGRLTNYRIRDHFLSHIFTRADFRKVRGEGKIQDLIAFHSRNKYLFMAYNQKELKVMGKIVANHEKNPWEQLVDEYGQHLALLLKAMPPSKRYVNVMMHILGYFSKQLTTNEKAGFLDLLEQFNNQQIPASAVMSVLKLWTVRFEEAYLLDQTIFEPFPKELITVSDSGKGRI